jgi:hypothetical protein
MRSLEADVLPIDDPDGHKADQIDSSLGEGSLFDQTSGIHADGVSDNSAVVPSGWRDRLIPYTNGVVGYCLEPHDLGISKLIAFREKDREFVRALIEAGLVDTEILLHRLGDTQSDDPHLNQARGFVEANGSAKNQI